MKKIFLAVFFLFCAVPSRALKIVSLMPSYTEIVFELGSGGELAGVSSYCNWPPETAKIERIGDYYRPDMEKIYALKPDLVLAGDWKNSPVAGNLEKLGLKVVVLSNEKRVEDIYRTIKIIAGNLGKKKEGGKLVARMKNEIAAAGKKRNGKRIFLEADYGLWTAGKGSFMNDVIEKAGGENVFSQVKKDYFKVSWEAVLEKDPDLIITLSTEPEEFKKMPLAGNLKAVRENGIIKLDKEDRDAFSRPSPRIAGVIEKLSKIMEGKK